MSVLLVIYIPKEDPDLSSVERQESLKETSPDTYRDSEDNDLTETDPLTADSQSIKSGTIGDDDCVSRGYVKQCVSGGQSDMADGVDDEKETLLNGMDEEAKSSTCTPSIADTANAVGIVKIDEARVKFEDQTADEAELIVERCTLEEVLQSYLDELNITTDVWDKTFDKNKYRVCILLEASECDRVMHSLTSFGFGKIAETSISLFTSSSHFANTDVDTDDLQSELPSEAGKESPSEVEKNNFIKSIKSRLTVAQVVVGVQANAQLTFDYIMLVIFASIIAALGLAENSSVVLVASMLVSPIMGPILGGVFGIVIGHKNLWKLGVKNELIGLSICIAVGFILGLVMAGVDLTGANWGSTDSWPTPEMRSRGLLRSLWVGVLIALPSGAGVALSILGGNTGSLVGVAISASLLPPAVNAGMLWAYALVSSCSHPAVETPPQSNATWSNMSDPTTAVPPHCLPLKGNSYEFVYTCYLPHETALLGLVSLILTFLNIICIFIMGIAVLKIKEVAPHTAVSGASEAFWETDIKVARHAYKTMKADKESFDLAKVARDLASEWKEQQKGADKNDLHELMKTVANDRTYQAAASSVPGGKSYPPLLRVFSRECDTPIHNIPHTSSYHTFSSIAQFHKEQQTQSNQKSLVKAPPNTPAGFVTPNAQKTNPSVRHSAKAEMRFLFDEEKVVNRHKHHRQLHGISRMLSSPAQVEVIPSKTKSKIKRFEVETIDEETLSK